jgi:serine/threonine protein kinase
MKIIINPQYNQLSRFISSINDCFEKEGKELFRGRNTIKRYFVEGYDIAVKSFKKPILINRIIYTFIRKSKARRSYEHAFLLLEKGIKTPSPIAYIEEKKNGLLNRSYYICIYDKKSSYIRKQMSDREDDGKEFEKQLAIYIAELHGKGILQKDLSPGNIMFYEEDGHFRFSIIDLNRMKFMSDIPLKTRYKNFKRLTQNKEIITHIAEEYAKASSLDVQEAVYEINRYSSDFSRRNN